MEPNGGNIRGFAILINIHDNLSIKEYFPRDYRAKRNMKASDLKTVDNIKDELI